MKGSRKPTGIILDGDKVRGLRKRKAMTQEDLAAAADLNPKEISKAETGAPISLVNMKAIANALGIGNDYDQILPPKALDVSPTPESKDDERVIIEIRVVRVSFPKSMSPEEIAKHTTRVFQEFKLEGCMTDGVRNPTGTSGSLVISGELTKADVRRIVAAFLVGNLSHIGVRSISIKLLRDPELDRALEEERNTGRLRTMGEQRAYQVKSTADHNAKRKLQLDSPERHLLHGLSTSFPIDVTLSDPVNSTYLQNYMPWFEQLERVISARDVLVFKAAEIGGTVVQFLITPEDAERLVLAFRQHLLNETGIKRIVYRSNRNPVACLDFVKGDTAVIMIEPPSVTYSLLYEALTIIEMIRFFEGYETAISRMSSDIGTAGTTSMGIDDL